MELTLCIQNNGLSPQPYNAPRCRFIRCPPQDEEVMPTYPPLVSPPVSIAIGVIEYRLRVSQHDRFSSLITSAEKLIGTLPWSYRAPLKNGLLRLNHQNSSWLD
jgi:hypothetical protein